MSTSGGRGSDGIFITFEGVEGSGKSTQFSRVAALLRRRRYRVVETREPGGTPLAERIRSLILDASTEPVAPSCEALLILAARSQHVARVIRPALEQQRVVLCDRFSDSTMAYQGYARGIPRSALRVMNHFASEGLSPDLTILLDVPVTVGLSRRRRGGAQDRLDRETRRFHERVRKGYLDLARKNRTRIKIVDGRPPADVVADKVASLVIDFLAKRGVKGRTLKNRIDRKKRVRTGSAAK